MPTYTVQGVAPNPRRYDANGPKLAYQVTFAEVADQGSVEWSQNATTPEPVPGQTVDGTITWDGPYGAKFKRDFVQQGAPVNGSSSSTTGGTWKPRDPSDTAAIQRQHSQEMALRFIAVNNAAVQAMQGKSASQALEEVVKPIVAWFQRDIETGKELAAKDTGTRESYGQPRNEPVQTGVSDVPNNNPPAHPPLVTADDLPF